MDKRASSDVIASWSRGESLAAHPCREYRRSVRRVSARNRDCAHTPQRAQNTRCWCTTKHTSGEHRHAPTIISKISPNTPVPLFVIFCQRPLREPQQKNLTGMHRSQVNDRPR